jgi:dUTP pyrophosphatase
MTNLKIKRLDARAVLPSYQTEGSSGLDLVAIETQTIRVGERALIRTGLAMEIPPGYEGQIRPRSGIASRIGVITVLGTVDADYRGEVSVLLLNHGALPFALRPGERFAQLVICPVARANVVEAEELGDTARGTGGFGSTGRR